MTNTEIKMTKIEALGIALEAIGDTNAEATAVITKEIERLERVAGKAKEKRANKKAEADEIVEVLAGYIAEEPITVDEIVTAYNANLAEDAEPITRNKAVAKIKVLVDTNRAYRTTVKGEDKKKRVAYTTVAPEGADEE